MKLIKLIISCLLLILAVEAGTKIMKNTRASRSNLKALEQMRLVPGSFDPNNITKYFKDQKPPTDKTVAFIDPLFPATSNTIEGKDENGNKIDPTMADSTADHLMERDIPGGKAPEWKRASYLFKNPFKVFKDSIEPADVKQAEIGDCYFISAIAAVTEFPQLIFQLFRTTTKSTYNYYEVVLFIDGEWQVVILDDYFVVKNGKVKTKFATPNGEEIWVMLLEKAWAKVNGGFANIVSGSDADSYYALTGFTTETIPNSSTSLDDLWQKILTSNSNNDIMAAGTSAGVVTENQLDNGIVQGHAYSLVGAVQIFNKGIQVRLVQLRNPWAKHEWTGDWSDNSPLWTDDLKKAANFKVAKDDGIFFMAVEDFVQFYGNTQLCHVQYGATVKSYNVKGADLASPVVFNLSLEEDTSVFLDTFVRHWRFNRGTGNNPTKMVSMMLGSYDASGNLSFSASNSGTKDYVEISKSLTKGNYVLWVYNSYSSLPDPKPDHYIVRLVSQSSKVNFQKVGLDSEAKLIRKLMNVAIGDNSTANAGSGLLKLSSRSFDNSSIGYTRLSNTNTSGTPMKVNLDFSKNINMAYLPPYNNLSSQNISIILPVKSSVLILGVKQQSGVPTLFSVPYTTGTLKSTESVVEYTENIKASAFLLASTKLSTFTRDYLTTSIADAFAAQNFRKFKRIK